MLACHRLLFFLLTFNLLINLSRQDLAVPVYTPDNESSIKNQQLDQLDKAKSAGNNDNLQAAGIVVPVSVIDPTNLTNNQTTSSKSNQNKSRKRKHQSNKQYRPNENSKSSLDSLAYNLKTNPYNELNNAILLQLAKQQQQKIANQQDQPNTELPFQLVPIFTTEPSVNSLLNNDPNQLAVQLYLRRLAQLALQQQKQKDLESRSERQEKPKITKRVFNSNSLSSNQQNLNNLQSSASSLQLANLNQFLNQQQQPVYTLIQPQQQPSTQPLYLALQPSFSVQSSSSKQQQPQNTQVNSFIETGDKIIAKIKQWSTDVFNPKSSLNRQINEVISLASDVALNTIIGVSVISALSYGASTLMVPLSQLNRKFDRKSAASKQQKTKSEETKKDKNNDEKATKSDQGSAHQSQKSTKSLDKKSRIVSILERAGDEVNHLKNLYEIAKNFDTAFKKYNVLERECRYRILCEVGSKSQLLDDKTTSNVDNQFLVNNNLLREGSKRKKRQIRSTSELNQLMSTTPIEQQLNKTIECEKKSNCSKSNSSATTNGNKVQYNMPTQTNFLLNQFKLIERNFLNSNRGSLRNLLHNFNLDRFINDNKDGFISFMATVDSLMNRAQKSNIFTYLLNDDHFNQAFRSENRLFKTIVERSKQLQDKLKDFLDNLTAFQQVVSKESQGLDFNKSKYDYRILPYYNLRSKRTASLNANKSEQNEPVNEFSEENVDVSGLKFILTDLISQLKTEQQQDNPILPISKIWLNPYLSAIEYGSRHGQERCKVKYLKCTQNYLGLNNGAFTHKLDLEIISNNHASNGNPKKKEEKHNLEKSSKKNL